MICRLLPFYLADAIQLHEVNDSLGVKDSQICFFLSSSTFISDCLFHTYFIKNISKAELFVLTYKSLPLSVSPIFEKGATSYPGTKSRNKRVIPEVLLFLILASSQIFLTFFILLSLSLSYLSPSPFFSS